MLRALDSIFIPPTTPTEISKLLITLDVKKALGFSDSYTSNYISRLFRYNSSLVIRSIQLNDTE